jgi:hypothetical protein
VHACAPVIWCFEGWSYLGVMQQEKGAWVRQSSSMFRLPPSAHAQAITGPSKNCMNPHTEELCQWHMFDLHPGHYHLVCSDIGRSVSGVRAHLERTHSDHLWQQLELVGQTLASFARSCGPSTGAFGRLDSPSHAYRGTEGLTRRTPASSLTSCLEQYQSLCPHVAGAAR